MLVKCFQAWAPLLELLDLEATRHLNLISTASLACRDDNESRMVRLTRRINLHSG